MGIVQANVSRDKYYKQSDALITVNNKDIQTNAYYIKLTAEECNNIYIKILEQITKDEIILSRIDLVENEIKEKYSNYEQDESLRQQFINLLNNNIEQIKNNNIGNEEVKITVYENNMKTIRTSIEKTTEKLIIDIDDSNVKINNIKLGDNTEEQIIKIQKNNNNTQTNTLIEFQKILDNEILNNIKINIEEIIQNSQIHTMIEVTLANGKYEGILKIVNNTRIIEEFENQVTLDTDNVDFGELQQEQKDMISRILTENIQGQLSNLFEVVSLDEYKKMLQNLDILPKSTVEIDDNEEVTEIQKKRFNSEFEFFVSDNLTTDNIKQLLETAKNNFEDMKILTKDGEIQELDIEKISAMQDNDEYIENISELLIFIKQNSTNQEKQEQTLKFIQNNENNKYNVSIEYDDNGLTRIIRMKIQKD